MRLIDADAINPMRVPQSVKEMRAWLDSQPTADAVPVIRCKDCKYYSHGMIEGKHMCLSVKYRFTPTTENEWCSRAERKEEE